MRYLCRIRFAGKLGRRDSAPSIGARKALSLSPAAGSVVSLGITRLTHPAFP